MSKADDYGREGAGFSFTAPPPPATPKVKSGADNGGDATPVQVLQRPDKTIQPDVSKDFVLRPPPPAPPPPQKKEEKSKGFGMSL